MDLALNFLKSKNIKTSGKFAVTGKSKRAWTALLVAAADIRVVACMPIVFDFINLIEVIIFIKFIHLKF